MSVVEDRQHSLGGSDASVICGLSPFKTAEQLLLEKAGIIPAEDARFEGHKRWGHLIEPVVREYTAEEMQAAIQPCGLVRYVHPEYPFLTAHLDGIITTESRIGIYEGKTTAASQKAKWKSGPPPEYVVQVLHYMLVTGLEYAVVAVLIGGNDYRRFELFRDEDDITNLLALEIQFWEAVQTKKKEMACAPLSS